MEIKISVVVLTIVGIFFLKISIDSNIFQTKNADVKPKSRIFKKTS